MSMACSDKHPNDHLVLGLDIGTTSVKLLLVDAAAELRCIYSCGCNIIEPPSEREGNSTLLCAAEMSLQSVLNSFHQLLIDCDKQTGGGVLHRVADVLLCGQMHGIALWQSARPAQECSRLVTWQDRRCSPEFLAQLPAPSGPRVVAPKTGFGLATLLWWQCHEPARLTGWDVCGTAMDWLAALLTDTSGPRPVTTSAQLAASWGYFDPVSLGWDTDSLAKVGLPSMLRLPEIVPTGTVVGTVATKCQHLPQGLRFREGCRVRVPLGDLQCVVYSVFASLTGGSTNISASAASASATSAPLDAFDGRAFFNVGTSAQLGFLTREPPPQRALAHHPGIESFPFFSSDRYILLAASLNGGDVLAGFVQMLIDWQEQLTGFRCDPDSVWSRLQVLANETGSAGQSDPDPRIAPTLFGERSRPAALGSVDFITPGNCRHLGRVYRSLCAGLVANLLDLCPHELLRSAGVTSVTLAGSAIRRNPELRRAAECALGGSLGFRVVLGDEGECDSVRGLVAQFLDSRIDVK